MTLKSSLIVALAVAGASRVCAEEVWTAPVSEPAGAIVVRVVMVQDEEGKPFAAGQAAAQALQHAMGGVPLKAVVISECFEDQENKQQLLAGVQQVLGQQFPATGGSVNKNAGQTFVYFRGQAYQDSAAALLLSGDFRVSLAGRLGKDQDAVIRTAREGAAEAMSRVAGQPLVVLAYNCAGRRGKLDDPAAELQAIQQAIGTTVPLFGCYNAGEIGPLDPTEKDSDALCGGSGWHVMFTVLSRD